MRFLRSWMRASGLLGAAAGVVCAVGCGVSDKASVDPLTDVANRTLSARSRAAAVEPARAEVEADPGRRAGTQKVFKDVVWTASEPPMVRMAALSSLVNDPDAAVAADAHETVKLLLPKERALPMTILMCRMATENGWKDCVPSLLRSYSRPTAQIGWIGGIKEGDRPEREAIEGLAGGRVEDVAFEMFMNPPPQPTGFGLDWTERFRADCWDLLARLDEDGSARQSMLARMPESSADPLIVNIRRCVAELHVVPLTGEELKWLTRLLDPKKPANAAWWQQATSTVARVPRATGLSLRHIESLRWAAETHPAWLAMSREELISELRAHLTGRTFHDREVEGSRYRVKERLKVRQGELSWADALTLLALDEVVRDPVVVRALASQAELDRKDQTTEYGGALVRKNVGIGAVPREAWVAALFPPRPGQRQGDERFVASDDMLTASDLAIAHYHFHAQKEHNDSFAGPSPGDLEYATRFGRGCVVFTSVSKNGRMDADYYQPGGVVVDLGEVMPTAEVDSGMRRGIGPR